jgi:hypothetical protein
MSDFENRLTLKIGFQEEAFAQDLAAQLIAPGVRPGSVIGELLSLHLTKSLRAALSGRFIKTPVAQIGGKVKSPFENLQAISEYGYEAWWPELRFSTNAREQIDDVGVECDGMTLEPIDYGWGVKQYIVFKKKPLRTQINYTVRLNHVVINPPLFKKVLDLVLSGPEIVQPYLPTTSQQVLSTGKPVHYPPNAFISFDHIIDGKRIFCSCAKPAHDQLRAGDASRAHEYVTGSWPDQIQEYLSDPKYVSGICHLCIARKSGPEAAADRYGDDLQNYVEVYTAQTVRTSSLDGRTARAEVQQLLGVSRWVKEADMAQVIKHIFPDQVIMREASPGWLGRQRLDVYLPQLNLALEYQGQQHYAAVSHFGGAEAFEKTVQRDALKKRLCEENGCDLVYVRFDEAISVASFKHRLRRYLRV